MEIEAWATEPPTAASLSPNARRLMTVLVSLYAVAYLDRFIIGIIAPDLRADLQISATQLALLQGFGFALFYVVAGLPIGALVDRISRRAIIFVGVLVWSVSASASGLAGSYRHLLFARFCLGAGEATLSPSGYSMIADSVPREKLSSMTSIFAGGTGIGAAISVYFGAVLMSWAMARHGVRLPLIGLVRPWQFVLLVTGLPGLLLAGSIFLVREPERRERVDRSGVGVRHLIDFVAERLAFFACCFGGFAMWQLMIYSFSLWVPTRLIKVFGWSYGQVGVVLAAGALLSALGSLVIGRSADRLVRRGRVDGPLIVAAVCSLISGAGIVLAFSVRSVLPVIVCLLIANAPSTLTGLGSAAVQFVAPNEYRGKLIAGLIFLTTLSGAGLGPLLPALLADKVFGDEARLDSSVVIVAGTASLLSVVLLLAARRPMRRAYAAAAAWRGEDR